MAGYAVSNIADMPDVPTLSDPGEPAWKPIQHYLGITAFGINAYTAREAGDELAGEHDESGFGQEEVYVVVAGRATFTVAGEEVDAPAGTVVAITDPSLTRSAEAVEVGTTILAVGCAPGCFQTSWQPSHFEGLARHPAVDS